MIGKMVVQGVCAVVYALEVAVLLWVTQSQYKKDYYVKVKMLCSTSFVIIGLIFAAVSDHWIYYLSILPTLLLCALGDFFMGCFQIKRYTRNMVLGIVSFLLAHICLLVLLYSIIPAFAWWNILFPIIGLVVLCLQKKLLHMHYGRLWWPVLIYSVFLTLDFAKSIEIMVLRPCISSAWIGLGGLLFFISDYTLNFCYFYKMKNKKRTNVMNMINLASYFFGILAFDMSILYFVK